jgi:K+-sensing histidine kinase KdpD
MDRPIPEYRGDVMVADDTPANLGVLATVLKRRGYRVRAFPSGALALEAAEVEAPDLFLLDVMMPQMDGFEVCRRLKENQKLRNIPVIFLSALSETLDKVKAFSAGGVDYVTKPFQVEELEARVATHIALRRLQLDLEESYARLQRLEQMRRTLTQMIVHDLKSPITAGYHNAIFVREDAGLQGELAVAIQDVVGSFQVLNRMSLDMLDVTASEETSLTPRLELMALRQLMEEVVTDVRGMARSMERELVIDVAGDLPAVKADRELLRRVLENLLDNTFKYAPEGSEVRMEAALAGGGAYAIRVRDQGPGIPIGERERVFDRYARLGRDAAEHARSSRGLGLAFCKLAVDAHRGRIWVEDNQPRGCTFVLELPIDPGGPGTVAVTPPELRRALGPEARVSSAR